MIKVLKPSEISLTRRASEAFFRDSKIDGVFNFSHYSARMANLIMLDVGVEIAYVSDNEAVGIIGGVVTPCLFTGDIIAVEQYWYVLPEWRFQGRIGLQLLREFEQYAHGKGAKRSYVGNLQQLNNEKMARLYRRLGYEPLETHFMKSLL